MSKKPKMMSIRTAHTSAKPDMTR